MTIEDLKNKIQTLVPKVIKKIRTGEDSAIEFEELIKYPKLKEKIIDLLTNDYGSFIARPDCTGMLDGLSVNDPSRDSIFLASNQRT